MKRRERVAYDGSTTVFKRWLWFLGAAETCLAGGERFTVECDVTRLWPLNTGHQLGQQVSAARDSRQEVKTQQGGQTKSQINSSDLLIILISAAFKRDDVTLSLWPPVKMVAFNLWLLLYWTWQIFGKG